MTRPALGAALALLVALALAACTADSDATPTIEATPTLEASPTASASPTPPPSAATAPALGAVATGPNTLTIPGVSATNDDTLPRFDGELNGIRLGPAVTHDPVLQICEVSPPIWATQDELTNSAMNPLPPDIPATARVGEVSGASCGGIIVAAEAFVSFEPGGPATPFGGHIQFFRFLGDPQFPGDFPDARTGATEIAGRAGIQIVPITAGGAGQSAIFLREEWGLTTLRATGIPAALLEELARSLYPPSQSPGATE